MEFQSRISWENAIQLQRNTEGMESPIHENRNILL